MKRRIHRNFLVIVLLGLLCCLAVSCDADPVPDNSFIGTWELYTVANGTSRTTVIQFYDDSNGKLSWYSGGPVNQVEYDLTYSLDGNNITFSLINESSETTYTYACTYKFDGNSRLNITGDDSYFFPVDEYYIKVE